MTTRTTKAAVPTRYRILIVDDHPIVREGLRHIIQSEADITVCAEAEDSHQTLRAVTSLCPDLALVDLMLYDSSGLDLIKTIHTRVPKLPILVVSMHDEQLYASRALRAGAQGFVMKQEAPEVLLGAIRQVLRGETYLSPSLLSSMLQDFALHRPTTSRAIDVLSDRELDVVSFLGHGYDVREIAERLHVSVKTVWMHRTKTMQKLQLKNTADLLRYATRLVQGFEVDAGDHVMDAPLPEEIQGVQQFPERKN